MVDKLKLRNAIKKRKPTFERQYANVMKQFKGSWNRPRGMHSKMRRGMRGKKLIPTVGFRSPVEARGLTREGFKPVVVSNIEQLKKVNSKEQIAVLASGMGMRKRIELLNKAIELKLPISNVKDPSKFVLDAKKSVEDRKKVSLDRKNKKTNKKEESEKTKEKENKKEEKAEKKAEAKKAETNKPEAPK
ncbi:MAG: eL32 family ribosomal protein [archaeon]|nr:eL32 family ribosomal protein [archaeon]